MGGGHVSPARIFGMPLPDDCVPRCTSSICWRKQALEKCGQLYAAPPSSAGLLSPCHRRLLTGGSRRICSLRPGSGRGLPGPRRAHCSPLPGCSFYYKHACRCSRTAPRRPLKLLTEECTRLTVAVQLLPPFVWEDPLPAAAGCSGAALTLQLTMQVVMLPSTPPPAALASRSWCTAPIWQPWLHHPKAETFLFRAAGAAATKGSINKEGAPSPSFTFLRFRGITDSCKTGRISNLCRKYVDTPLRSGASGTQKMEGSGFCSAIIGDAEPYIE